MPLKEAESRWPEVAYRAGAPVDYARAILAALDVLAELSPTVEWSAEPDRAPLATRHEPAARYAVFLDATGLAPLYGSEERLARLIVGDLADRAGHEARVGIADGRYAALLAARAGIPIVAPGGDAAFLASLPVAALPLPAPARDRIASLGVRTLADFARLPANALRHRFGPDGVLARALAAGHDEGTLRPRPTPLRVRDAIDLEWIETSQDRLLFLLKRLADRLSVRLAHHGLGCGRLRVTWLLEGAGLTTGDDPAEPSGSEGRPDDGAVVSTVRLAEQAGGAAGLLEHLRWHVDGLRPEAFRDPDTGQRRGVRGIVVEAEELGPLVGRQLALLTGEDGRAANPDRLLAAEQVLARLQARWGEAAVRQAELVASRRPERAFRWREGGLALRADGIEDGMPGRGALRRAVRTPRPSVRRGGAAPAAIKEPRREAGRPESVGDGPLAPPLWLHGAAEEVEVERGGRLPNGRHRRGSVTQGTRVRRIVRAAGPWRLVEPWAAEPVARDAYHVVLSDGTACWLVHDRLDDRWRLFGTFD